MRANHALEDEGLGKEQELRGGHGVGHARPVARRQGRRGRRVDAREDMHEHQVLARIMLVLVLPSALERESGALVLGESDAAEGRGELAHETVVVLLPHLLATAHHERQAHHTAEREWVGERIRHHLGDRVGTVAGEVELL